MRVTFVLLVMFVGLGLTPVASGETAEFPAAAAAVEPSTVSVPLVIPSEEKRRRNPLPLTDEAIEGGMSLFASQCAMCHGPLGRGNGGLALKLKLKTPNFSDPAVQKKRTDGELHYILTEGHGDMPGQGKRLPENWKWELIHAIRTMAQGAK